MPEKHSYREKKSNRNDCLSLEIREEGIRFNKKNEGQRGTISLATDARVSLTKRVRDVSDKERPQYCVPPKTRVDHGAKPLATLRLPWNAP